MGEQKTVAPWRLPSDELIAHYLGLSANEYCELSHSGIYALYDHKGDIIQFYTIISPLNPEHLLNKIKMNRMRMIVFSIFF